MASVGVFELLLPVPADDADVKLAIQDAGTDDTVSTTVQPSRAARSRHWRS